MIFDAHVHIGKLKKNETSELYDKLAVHGMGFPRCGLVWDRYVRYAERSRIVKALVIPFPFDFVNSIEANNYVLGAAKERPDILMPVCLISNDYKYFEDNIEKFVAAKDEFYVNCNIDDANYRRVLGILEDKRLPLIIHAANKDRVRVLTYIGDNYPNLPVIIAHAGRYFPYSAYGIMEETIPLCNKFQNFYVDTSTVSLPDILYQISDTLESGRVLYGSDYPFYKIGETGDFYENDLKSYKGIGGERYSDILYGNAKRLFYKGEWIRACTSDDSSILKKCLEMMSPEDVGFLALSCKMGQIMREIRNPYHLYCVEYKEKIVTLVRISDRPNNSIYLEEIYTDPEYRMHGFACKMLSYLITRYARITAKSFKKNIGMTHLFLKCGFRICRDGVRTRDWVKD